jgi:hypothetical protein
MRIPRNGKLHWYTKVLGPADGHLVQWEFFDQSGLMLSSSDEIAGKGVMFVYVDHLAAERRRLHGLGIAGDAARPALPASMTAPESEIRGMAPNMALARTRREPVKWCAAARGTTPR